MKFPQVGETVTSVLVIIVNSLFINKTMLFDPNICLFMFDILHVLIFIRFQTLHRFLESDIEFKIDQKSKHAKCQT